MGCLTNNFQEEIFQKTPSAPTKKVFLNVTKYPKHELHEPDVLCRVEQIEPQWFHH